MNATRASVADLARLNFLLAELYAKAVLATQRRFRVKAELVGCHGQTLYHQGEAARFLGGKIAATWQTGEGAVIAARVGVPVVSDFRPADMAAGGKGAPLVPFLDYLLYRDTHVGRIVQNIGGIANLTAIPAGASAAQVLAFDTGPGNMVIDASHRAAISGKPYDRDGRIAASGVVLEPVVAECFADAVFPAQTAEDCWARGIRAGVCRRVSPAMRARVNRRDVVATATALTASSIADALRRFVLATASRRMASLSFPAAARIIRHSWRCWRTNWRRWACRSDLRTSSDCLQRRKKRRRSHYSRMRPGTGGRRMFRRRRERKGRPSWERSRMREGRPFRRRAANAQPGAAVPTWLLPVQALLAFVLLVSFLSCSAKSDPETLVMIIESSPTNLDPRVGLDAQSERIDNLLFDDLLTRDEHLNVRPALAERWEIPDPRTYVFHLAPGREISRWAAAHCARCEVDF